jgi:hypothetical protein
MLLFGCYRQMRKANDKRQAKKNPGQTQNGQSGPNQGSAQYGQGQQQASQQGQPREADSNQGAVQYGQGQYQAPQYKSEELPRS